MRTALFVMALVLSGGVSASCAQNTKSQAACTLRFSLAQRDVLGNVDVGLSPADTKWLKGLSKRYPEICYVNQAPNEGMWFYIDISNQTADSATAISRSTLDSNGGMSTHTTVDMDRDTVYTLKVGEFRDGKLQVLRTFQRVKPGLSRGTVMGLLRTFGNPKHDLILDALNWIGSNAEHAR